VSTPLLCTHFIPSQPVDSVPYGYRDTQEAWYAKKVFIKYTIILGWLCNEFVCTWQGFTWFGATCYSIEGGEVRLQYYHVITDDKKKDSFHARSCIEALLCNIKRDHAQIEEARLCSDNAGEFSATINSVVWGSDEVHEMIGLQVMSIDRSPAQKGKGLVDGKSISTEGACACLFCHMSESSLSYQS